MSETVARHRFALVAFLIPLAIRAIPEILVGPYPVGWDTIAFYVPNTLDWAAGNVNLPQILGTPLLYIISVPAYLISKVNPIWIFKVMGPVLYGTLIWSLFRFLRRALQWPELQALGGALLTSFYFVTLRTGWDLYRIMLGVTFILLSLPFLEQSKSIRNQMALSGLLALAVVSDQLTAVIALFLVGVRALTEFVNGGTSRFFKLMRVSTPSIVLFAVIVYDGVFVNGGSLVQAQPLIPSSDTLVSSAGFFVYAYLPIFPLVVFGFRSVKSIDLRMWALFCLTAALTAMLPLLGLMVLSYRWTVLIDVPLCVFASAGLFRLLNSTITQLGWLRVAQRSIPSIAILILLLFTGLYVALPAQKAIPYYAAFPDLLPSSMVQGTVPLSDMGNLRNLLGWVAVNLGPSTALITHQAIYGWARAYLPLGAHVLNYGYSGPIKGLEIARSIGYSTVLVIWWVNGMGWHGQPNLPSYFAEDLCAGNMCVYETQTDLAG